MATVVRDSRLRFSLSVRQAVGISVALMALMALMAASSNPQGTALLVSDATFTMDVVKVAPGTDSSTLFLGIVFTLLSCVSALACCRACVVGAFQLIFVHGKTAVPMWQLAIPVLALGYTLCRKRASLPHRAPTVLVPVVAFRRLALVTVAMVAEPARFGDRVVAAQQVYGDTRDLLVRDLPACGLDVVQVDAADLEPFGKLPFSSDAQNVGRLVGRDNARRAYRLDGSHVTG